MANEAFQVNLDTTSWRQLQRDLKNLAPEYRKQFNKQIKQVGARIVSDAKSNASWSSRIPGAIALSVTGTRIGVKASRRKAPHARPYEGISGVFGAKGFRHPVFGNRQVWVAQAARPFMAPAVKENQEAFFEEAAEIVDDAARQVGWH